MLPRDFVQVLNFDCVFEFDTLCSSLLQRAERKPPTSHNLYFTLCRSRKLFNIFISSLERGFTAVLLKPSEICCFHCTGSLLPLTINPRAL